MKRKKVFLSGLAMLAVAFVLNLQWSLQDYGIKSITLSQQILAQGHSKNNGTDTGGGTLLDDISGKISHVFSKKYSAIKVHNHITREVTDEFTFTDGLSVAIAISPAAAITRAISAAFSKKITYTQYLYECQEGQDDIFCMDSWRNSPYK